MSPSILLKADVLQHSCRQTCAKPSRLLHLVISSRALMSTMEISALVSMIRLHWWCLSISPSRSMNAACWGVTVSGVEPKTRTQTKVSDQLYVQTLNLSPALSTGLILVSCCPGGQASNVATYIAHGDVALSVLMTTASTIGAIFMTPILTKLLAGTLVPVDAKVSCFWRQACTLRSHMLLEKHTNCTNCTAQKSINKLVMGQIASLAILPATIVSNIEPFSGRIKLKLTWWMVHPATSSYLHLALWIVDCAGACAFHISGGACSHSSWWVVEALTKRVHSITSNTYLAAGWLLCLGCKHIALQRYNS